MISVSLKNQRVFSYESQSGWQHKVLMYKYPLDACASIKRPKDEKNSLASCLYIGCQFLVGPFPVFALVMLPMLSVWIKG